MEKPTFGLADTPDNWEIRLHDDFVLQLDKLNRPWAYEGKLRGDSVYWYRSTLRNRTKDRMTQEELDYYYASYRFSERLWGTKARKQKKYGSFIRKDMIPILRQGVEISDSELERAITGIKFGYGSDRILNCERLPIKANKYWAWFMGLFYSSGSIRFRDPATSIRATRESIEMVFRANKPVLDLGVEYAEEIGVYFRIFDRVGDRKIKPGKTKGMRTGRRLRAGFGWVEYRILEKFGMSTHFKEDAPSVVARFWKPIIPDWIKEDDECMMMFVEGLLNGNYGGSALSKPRKGKNLVVSVIMRITGLPKEYTKTFAETLRDWFNEQGLTTAFREFKQGYSNLRGKCVYEVSMHSWDSIWWILGNLNIARADLRARLLARVRAREDPIFNEAMMQLKSPHNVVLSLIAEEPMTADELDQSIQVKKEGIIAVLKSLQMRGLVTRRRQYYYYDPKKFEERELKRKEGVIEVLSKRAQRYATRLLYRCISCKKVYVIERTTCGRCGATVEPVERMKVMQGVHTKRKHTLFRLRKLKRKEKWKENESEES